MIRPDARTIPGVSTISRPANRDDVPSWLELVPEAEQLFGPMPAFDIRLRRSIDRGTAVVVADRDEVAGGALLSRDGEPHHIHWLYVRETRRRQGVGAALLFAILDRWPAGDIEVVTFTVALPGGEAARALYERFGFVSCGRTVPAPDGGARDLFVLRR